MKPYAQLIASQAFMNRLRNMRLQVRSIPYRMGDTVECPICQNHYKAFMPFRYRQNAYCPSCKSLERHRYAYLTLRDRLGFYDAPLKKVLHFAPDTCLSMTVKGNQYIDYLTADNMTSFTHSITDKPDCVMSIDDIQFEDNTFDVVIAIGVLVMVPDDTKAMREVYRVLKPGGYAIFHDPINYKQSYSFSDTSLTKEEKLGLYHGHDQRWYYGADYADRMRAQGFEIEDDTYAQHIDNKRYGISPNEKIYIARK
ncbi:class I SAM-dependent methyltransferase [Runella salmonicolor]|uniref:Class I SAM-dependent methyltransferase n=1 Tax=Runella salmonicolor TaxID=2950278 RepID=A0ABT1FUJ5_9BACT|nr:class I SAM-dependent methyltransferase [Runella salmonicolor]MCP1384333.1 class I SAM-dependent methyltransferase [Runella salmonicolor]